MMQFIPNSGSTIQYNTMQSNVKKQRETRMWANAQRDGCPAEHGGALCSTPQSLADAHY